MFQIESMSGITRRFRDFASDVAVDTNDLGFVEPSRNSYSVEQILTRAAILVRGQPWVGKTYLAKKFLEQQTALNLGNCVWHLPLERHTIGRSIKPPGWDEWRLSRDQKACWIIDSIDEGEIIQPNIHTEIISLLEGVGKHTCSRLKVVVFVRESEVPEELWLFLKQHFEDSFADVELLPLDQQSAERIVGGHRLDIIERVIQRFTLQSVARYPAALEYISRHDDCNLSETEVWRGVLTELLRERRIGSARIQIRNSDIDHLFQAASHLAVVMTFGNLDRLATSPSDTGYVDPAELVSPHPAIHGATRAAVRDVLKTAMFHNGRFAQKNIREWMCAFGLADVGLSRLRPLVTDFNGKLNRKFNGVLSLLHRTTSSGKEVGNWILQKNGGVPPVSDVVLGLDEAVSIIDRLESISDVTTWNVNLWGNRGLGRLDTPGIGSVVAERISDPTRSDNRRELLLQIAVQTESAETLDASIAIVGDARAGQELRRAALGCILRLGNESHLSQLGQIVRQANPSTRVEKAIVSSIITRFLNDEIWAVEECARYAPDSDGEIIDSTDVLAHRLQEKMTSEAARIIINSRLPDVLSSSFALF